MLGHFNYGRRGILDLTHTRLFTVSSFRRLLRNAGFRIDSVRCFGPPVADLAGGGTDLLLTIDRISALLARNWKGLFGYQILIEATRPDSVESLMAQTFLDHRESAADRQNAKSAPGVDRRTTEKYGKELESKTQFPRLVLPPSANSAVSSRRGLQ
jgi:hypothetical protein